MVNAMTFHLSYISKLPTTVSTTARFFRSILVIHILIVAYSHGSANDERKMEERKKRERINVRALRTNIHIRIELKSS